MTGLNLTPNLTQPYGADFAKQVSKTHVGMAHFAGTGPKGARCHQCKFWNEAAYAARPDANLATIKPATCKRFTQLTNKVGQKIPAKALACKYFEAFSHG